MNKKSFKKLKNNTKSTKKINLRSFLLKNIKSIMITVLVILVGVLGFYTYVFYNYTNLNLKEYNRQLYSSLEASNAMLGFSCGALTTNDAQQFLGSEVTMKSLVSGSIWYGQKTANGGELGAHEGCYYESKTNNSFYASLQVNSYSSEYYAQFAFQDSLNMNISDKSEESHPLGKLVYNDQGYNLVKGNRVLTVSANKGNASTHKSDSKALFDMVVNKLP
ncbi:MAG: hypothetical protein M3Q79_01630 [bacterium]|nr:hypothetical protein [bacterium]